MAKIATWGDVFNNIMFSKRMKSLYWRTGMMILAGIIDQFIILTNNAGLPTEAVIILGLVLGEISKGISNSIK